MSLLIVLADQPSFFIDQLPGFVAGAIFGTALGWSANAVREARRASEQVAQVLERLDQIERDLKK